MNSVTLIGKLAGDITVEKTKNDKNEPVDMYIMTLLAETQAATKEECLIKCKTYDPAQTRAMKYGKKGDGYAVTGHLISEEKKWKNKITGEVEKQLFYYVHADQVEKIFT